MDTVEDVERLSRAFGNDLQVGLPPIAGDEAHRACAGRAQPVEETPQRFLGAFTGHPQQAPSAVVDLVDDREVLVALPHGDLVHANGFDALEGAVGQAVVDDPLHRPVDDAPIRLEDRCDLGPREPLCPACQKRPLHRARTVLAVGPGDPLGHHTTPAAVDPPHPVEQHDRESPQGHELEPSRLPSSVVDRVLESAVRTDGFAAFARLHLNVDTVPHKAGRAVHEA